MARIESKKVNRIVAEMAPLNMTTRKHDLMWLGYDDTDNEGYHLDKDREYPGYANWGTNEQGAALPDNVFDSNGNGQDCVAINYRGLTLWDDHFCYERMNFKFNQYNNNNNNNNIVIITKLF